MKINKRCVFCGFFDLRYKRVGIGEIVPWGRREHKPFVAVECKSCKAITEPFNEKKDALEAFGKSGTKISV